MYDEEVEEATPKTETQEKRPEQVKQSSLSLNVVVGCNASICM